MKKLIRHIGNATVLDGNGVPVKYQVRYDCTSGLRRRYEIWENGKPMQTTNWQELSPRHEGPVIEKHPDAMITFSKVEDDQQD